MHGTSGSYGFDEVARACGEWEELLKRRLAEGRPPDEETLARVDALLERVSAAIAPAEAAAP